MPSCETSESARHLGKVFSKSTMGSHVLLPSIVCFFHFFLLPRMIFLHISYPRVKHSGWSDHEVRSGPRSIINVGFQEKCEVETSHLCLYVCSHVGLCISVTVSVYLLL